MIRYLRGHYWVGWFALLMTVATLSLNGCGSSPPPQRDPSIDSELVRYNRAAQQAFDKGRLQQAAGFYRRALGRAYVRDDTTAILDARYNLAVCLLNLQSYEEALEVVRQAKTEIALSDHGKSADFLLLEATLLYRRGNPDAAWQVTDQILTAPNPADSVVAGKTHFLRGLIASEQGKTDPLRTAIAALGEPQDIQLRADHQELLGRLAMAEQDWKAAIEAFDRTTRLRREALDYRALVRALVLAGQANEKAGRTREAAIRYLRAGRSALLQEEFDDAQKWLNESVQLADSVGEDQIKQEARSLLRQIETLNATPPERSESKPTAMK